MKYKHILIDEVTHRALDIYRAKNGLSMGLAIKKLLIDSKNWWQP